MLLGDSDDRVPGHTEVVERIPASLEAATPEDMDREERRAQARSLGRAITAVVRPPVPTGPDPSLAVGMSDTLLRASVEQPDRLRILTARVAERMRRAAELRGAR